MNGCIIPEENEKSINPQQENAIFLVMGDEAYTDEMIDEYNRNAEAKTEEFNTNATNKLNAFNENATTKTNAFNTNATTQTDTYNSNAATKLSEYNDNATAKEQSYNSNADTKTQAFNQNAAQKEYEFNQNALAYQEGIEKNTEEIDEVSNRVYRIENNLYDSGTAEGYFINIEDSSYSEFQNVSVDGVCEQETTQGIQLFNANAIVTENIIVSDNGKTITMPIAQNGNGGIDTNATLKQLCPTLKVGDTVYLNFERNLSPEYNNYINLAGEDFIWYVNTQCEITQADLDGNVYLYGNRFVDGEQEQCMLTNFRITRKNEDLFEPYTGGQPSPSPDYPQPIDVIEEDFNITSCGKNLYYGTSDSYSFTTDINSWYDISGNKNINGSDVGTKTIYKTPVKKGETYTAMANVTGSNITNMGLVYDDEDLVYALGFIWTEPHTFVAKKDGYVLFRFWINSPANIEVSNIQLERGTEATEYEPYQGTTTAIVLPEGQFAAKINDTAKDQFRIAYDESDGNYHLYLDKNISKKILNGSEEWGYDNKENDIIQWKTYLGDNLYTNDDAIHCMSNYFIGTGFNYSWDTNNSVCMIGDGWMRINTNLFVNV